jgi:hypothetical protein
MEDLVPGTEQTPAKTVVEGSSIPLLDSTVNAENIESEKQSMTDDQPINRHPH